MYVHVNGSRYCSKTGMLEIKRRFGSTAVLVSCEEERPCIAPVDALGRFLVHDGSSYDVYSLQTGDARTMALLASERDARCSQRTALSSQQNDHKRNRSRSGNDRDKIKRRKGNYVNFVQSFMKGFHRVSFSEAAKEWRLFPEELKRTASVEVLLERVRVKGVYEPSMV